MTITILLLSLAASGLAQSKSFDEFVDLMMEKYHVPGAAIAIVREGQVVHLKGYGVRTVGNPQKVDADTIFSVASVTKTFTSALVASLVDEGKMEWDKPLAEDFPQIRLAEPFPTAEVTVRDLLVHRSGLPAFDGDFFDALGYDREEVVRRISKMPLSLGFRKEPGYSNVGFFLAGQAAASLDGTSWEKALENRIIAPLKLTRTAFWEEPITPVVNVASPHLLEGEKVRSFDKYDSQSVLAPAGLLSTTASDLSRFMLMLLNQGELDGKRVLSVKSVNTLFTPVIAEEPGFSEMPPIGPNTGYDYSPGWGIYQVRDARVVEKGGARTGVRSIVTLVPEKKFGVAILCNLNGTAFPEAVRARLLSELLEFDDAPMQKEIFRRQAELDKLFGPLSVNRLPAPTPTSVMTVKPKQLVGEYESPLYGSLKVTSAASGLRWEAGLEGYGGALYPVGNSTFVMDVPPGSLPGTGTFVVDEAGKVVELQTEVYGSYFPRGNAAE